jgi:uncharacterized protein YgbK (DUF1537 family)
VVAGGETSGAVVDGLGPAPLALLLKSGNFGQPDLLVHAAETS